MHARTHTHMHACMHSCIHARTHASHAPQLLSDNYYIHAHIHTCTHAYMHTRTHTHTHALMHTCTHVHTHTHTLMHTCTHAHTHLLTRNLLVFLQSDTTDLQHATQTYLQHASEQTQGLLNSQTCYIHTYHIPHRELAVLSERNDKVSLSLH